MEINKDYYVIIQRFWTNNVLQPFIGVFKKSGLFVAGVTNIDNHETALLTNLIKGKKAVITFEKYVDAEKYVNEVFANFDICKQAPAHRKNLLPEQIAVIIVCAEIAKDINHKR